MDIVEKYIGKWGPFQTRLYILLCLPFALPGIHLLSFTFTGGVPESRCFLPNHENSSSGFIPYNTSYLKTKADYYYAEPVITRGKTEYCRYCKAAVDQPKGPAKKCDADKSVPCTDGHVYDTSQYKTTLAAKFALVCNSGDWYRTAATSFLMLGVLIGDAVSGCLSDCFGRRPIFLVTSLLGVVAVHLMLVVPSFKMLCFVHALIGATLHGAFIIAFVILMEYSGGVWSTVAGIVVQGAFSVGYIYVGVCAYFIREWKWLQLACCLPSVLLLPYYWFIPESIRWLITQGRFARAKELIIQVASYNGMPASEGEVDLELKRWGVSARRVTPVVLFTNKQIAQQTAIVFYSWFATSMTYYGLSLNASDLPGNDYGNYILLGVIELPAYVVAIPMVQKWGRKPSIVAFFGFGGIAIIVSTFLNESMSWLILVLASIGKMGAAASFSIIYLYSAELFPTVARGTGMGVSSSFARMASISAPIIHLLTRHVQTWVPFLLYGLFAVIAALLDLFLPETLGIPLADTMDDAIAQASVELPRLSPGRPQQSRMSEKYKTQENRL